MTDIDALHPDGSSNSGHSIDPIILKILKFLPVQLVSPDGPEASRASFRALTTGREPWIAVDKVEDRSVPGPDGGNLGIRIYWPRVGEVLPVLLFIHGGGWSIGDLDTHDALARAAAVQAHTIVVSVDYRLAPEFPYPAAVEDCWAALQWVAAHAGELGGDPKRLAVAGDSAGGNLSAVLAQLARDHWTRPADPAVIFQLLWYPVTTMDASLPSMLENAQAPVLDARAIGTLCRWYLGETDLSSAPATLVPARANTFEGLAPAYIATAQFDPLRDDGASYAELLRAAQVPVELHNAETMVHGYLGYADIVPTATAGRDKSLAALKKALHA